MACVYVRIGPSIAARHDSQETWPLRAVPGASNLGSDTTLSSGLHFLPTQVTALSALYMAANPWLFFYDADKGEICPYT